MINLNQKHQVYLILEEREVDYNYLNSRKSTKKFKKKNHNMWMNIQHVISYMCISDIKGWAVKCVVIFTLIHVHTCVFPVPIRSVV